MKRKLNTIIILILLFLHNSCAGITNEKYYEYIHAVINDKSVIYNSLNLTEEQRAQYEQITKKYTPQYSQKIKEIITENSKQNPNKNITKKIEKEIHIISQNEDKELKTILNRLQRAKYRQIKHLENHDLKKEKHLPNYYKLNPQMTPFGNPKPQCR